ncbi:hypothetical protein N3K66_007920 [Trichothecium roseum]|uniref:Uncharacterized protein n=1 Tax=Trichothecium roseum TaxID=47278 RepID=A0ACC0US07_9HYPO|nr:hypothetical protein N3K66_007920 [Trichothecium roseum]
MMQQSTSGGAARSEATANTNDNGGNNLGDGKSRDPDPCQKCGGQSGSHDPACGNRYRSCFAPSQISKVVGDGEKEN